MEKPSKEPLSGNLIPNASFEEADGERPALWRTFRWGGEGELDYAKIGCTGGRSVMISSTSGADLSFGIILAARPYSRYRLSGWIKTENLKATTGVGALFNLHAFEGGRTPAVTGTRDWTRVEVEFDTGANDSLHVNCLYGGWGFATGTAWYDDVRLELLSTRELRPSAAIHATKTKAPISKYIYGQFIEHLGRCIYGGIWAEMLEDRKFFLPVGAPESPWKPMGPDSPVRMTKDGAYVGEHTPEVHLTGGGAPAGILQGDLGLIEGKEYTGRIILAGDPGTAPIDVSLVFGPDESDRDTVVVDRIGGGFDKFPLRFTSGRTTNEGRLEIKGKGGGVLRIGTVSLMPADHVRGMRADTLKLLKELDSPVYRWPGGNFVSGYDWKDGIGDPDRRPPRKNPAWTGIEHNDFGLHEFIDFCREIDTEPYVTVNTGLGTKEMASEEVEYCNGGPDTPMGRLRARNGHPAPFKVKWWAVGNEMYGRWQLGHMPLADYVEKHNQVVEAMRRIDPSIKLVAVGAVGPWTERMMADCADHMDLISEHFYVQEMPGVMAHAALAPRAVKRICDAHRRYRDSIPSLADKDIPIAMDEWNYWYGPHLYGELGVRYFLKDALGVAAALHEYFRNSDIVYMANYAQTVNVIGCIKTSKTAAAFATTGQVLKLYRREYGVIPVEVGGAPEPLDVAVAWTEDRKALTLGIVNPTRERYDLPLEIEGARLTGNGRLWIITGPDAMAYNEPGKPPAVAIEERAVSGFSGTVPVPPVSVLLYRLDARM